jgi:hypothetical protein
MKKLSEIVHYLNELDRLDLDTESLSTVRYMDHVFHVATAFDFQIHERSAELNRNVEDVKQAILDKKITSTHHIDLGLKYYDDILRRESIIR